MTQSVLVTAGGSGIGLAIAKAFLQTGADVHLVDQDQEALTRVTQANPAFQATCIDVSDEQRRKRDHGCAPEPPGPP